MIDNSIKQELSRQDVMRQIACGMTLQEPHGNRIRWADENSDGYVHTGSDEEKYKYMSYECHEWACIDWYAPFGGGIRRFVMFSIKEEVWRA